MTPYACVVVLASFVCVLELPRLRGQQPPADSACRVTTPNGIVAGSSRAREDSYGNAQLSVGPFGLWPGGIVVFQPRGAGFATRDDALGMKFGWTRGIPGRLRITGHRLDGEAPPLRSHIPCCYGENDETGFQATYLIFPTPGCWEVVAQVGDRTDSKLSFVTKVVKIGEGPARWNPSDHQLRRSGGHPDNHESSTDRDGRPENVGRARALPFDEPQPRK
jgi:hypothetical protein